MKYFNRNSLELYIISRISLLSLPFPLLFAWWATANELDTDLMLLGEFLIVLFLIIFNFSFKKRLLTSFDRATLHLEAINNEDYKQFAKPSFTQGKVIEFHQQLNKLSIHLQQQKSRYDQHAFLVYQLIEQLNTPMLVFNVKGQLSFANAAFHQLYNQPWQMFRHGSHDLLGLEESTEGWRFKESTKNRQWQIRQSVFEDSDDLHQLLVFVNIESALRASQLDAWQQIIRVLSHEIRNSLTPVSSLAESLLERLTKSEQANSQEHTQAQQQDKQQQELELEQKLQQKQQKKNNERNKQALSLIADRCLHLQNFVERYASLSKTSQLNCQWLNIQEIVNRMTSLYQQINVESKIKTDKIWADAAFFEQVLINLFKNAVEADATKIKLEVSSDQQFSEIKIIDNGHGFSNIDNLFVPLYSTKPQGQGIGLSFCRNIIEQHHGTIELANNKSVKDGVLGVTIVILLPLR
ncbi:MAG: ATP-binding protein [Alteromonadaceae bacterium]|nr:ATP-binding protein [Alteromonadaceae bacterium]